MSERAREEAKTLCASRQFRELHDNGLMMKCATATIPMRLAGPPHRTRTKSDGAIVLTSWELSARILGLPNIYTYKVSRRTNSSLPRLASYARSCVQHRGICQRLSFSWLERRLHDHGANHLHDVERQRQIPANPKLILDITPVGGQVRTVMLASAAQACVEGLSLCTRQPPAIQS